MSATLSLANINCLCTFINISHFTMLAVMKLDQQCTTMTVISLCQPSFETFKTAYYTYILIVLLIFINTQTRAVLANTRLVTMQWVAWRLYFDTMWTSFPPTFRLHIDSIIDEEISVRRLITFISHDSVITVSFSQGCPYQVILESSAAAIMDIHAHLCKTEVIGLLGGKYDKDAGCMRVLRAEPCSSKSTSLHCDMDPG